jgi:hypothetical protein
MRKGYILFLTAVPLEATVPGRNRVEWFAAQGATVNKPSSTRGREASGADKTFELIDT